MLQGVGGGVGWRSAGKGVACSGEWAEQSAQARIGISEVGPGDEGGRRGDFSSSRGRSFCCLPAPSEHLLLLQLLLWTWNR